MGKFLRVAAGVGIMAIITTLLIYAVCHSSLLGIIATLLAPALAFAWRGYIQKTGRK